MITILFYYSDVYFCFRYLKVFPGNYDHECLKGTALTTVTKGYLQNYIPDVVK